MAQTAVRKPAAARTRKPTESAEKQKPIGFVNWSVVDDDGNRLLSSSRGFALFDNDYLTKNDKVLLEEAKKAGGTVVLKAELRVSVAKDENETVDISAGIVPKK